MIFTVLVEDFGQTADMLEKYCTKGANLGLRKQNLFRVNPDNLTVTPNNNGIAGLFLADKSFLDTLP